MANSKHSRCGGGMCMRTVLSTMGVCELRRVREVVDSLLHRGSILDLPADVLSNIVRLLCRDSKMAFVRAIGAHRRGWRQVSKLREYGIEREARAALVEHSLCRHLMGVVDACLYALSLQRHHQLCPKCVLLANWSPFLNRAPLAIMEVEWAPFAPHARYAIDSASLHSLVAQSIDSLTCQVRLTSHMLTYFHCERRETSVLRFRAGYMRVLSNPLQVFVTQIPYEYVFPVPSQSMMAMRRRLVSSQHEDGSNCEKEKRIRSGMPLPAA